jgi:hypothetical protein
MDLVWENRGLVQAIIGDRKILVGGEALLEGNPDFLVYAQYLNSWEDGTPLTVEEKATFLDDLVEEARRRGWKFEILW